MQINILSEYTSLNNMLLVAMTALALIFGISRPSALHNNRAVAKARLHHRHVHVLLIERHRLLPVACKQQAPAQVRNFLDNLLHALDHPLAQAFALHGRVDPDVGHVEKSRVIGDAACEAEKVVLVVFIAENTKTKSIFKRVFHVFQWHGIGPVKLFRVEYID